MIERGKEITFGHLIDAIRNKEDSSSPYCVYGQTDSNEMTLDTTCIVGEYPEVTDDDEEIYPEYTRNNNLTFLFRDELLQDVIHNALYQKNDVSNQEILKAIKYYNTRDAFMEL